MLKQTEEKGLRNLYGEADEPYNRRITERRA